MGIAPAFPTYAAGEIPSASKLNQMKTWADFIDAPPQVFAYQSSASNLTNNAYTLVPFDAELFDIVQAVDAATPMHDVATLNSRLVFRTAGKYEISGQLTVTANTTGARNVNVRMNAAGSNVGGTSLYTGTTAPVTGTVTAVPIPQLVLPFGIGDYVELFGFQNSGGTLATINGQNNTFLRVKRVSA